MNEKSLCFLKKILSTPGPSSAESDVSRIWRNEAQVFADTVYADVRGNSFAELKADSLSVLLAGHIDEIGIMVKYIDDDGYLAFATVGDWDSQILVGQRVRLLGRQGEVIGVIGQKPIHLLNEEEKKEKLQVEDLWIDIGATSRTEVKESIRVGAVGVVDTQIYDFPHNRLVSRALDNRIGAFAILEVLRRLAQDRPCAAVIAVATSQEETTQVGAITSSFRIKPNVAIVIDTAYTTDFPDANRMRHGDLHLGGGPILARGSANNPVVYGMLEKIADNENIPYSIFSAPMQTYSDADVIHTSRDGVATANIYIPCRYLHSPNEMIEMTDIENAVKLVTKFIRSLSPEIDFVP